MNRKRTVFGFALILAFAMGAALATAQPMTATPAPAPAAMTATPAPAAMAPEPAAMGSEAPVPAQPTPAASASPTVPDKPKAEAPAAKKDGWGKVLLGGLLEVLLAFVLAFALALGTLLIRWVAKKMKVTDAEQIKSFEDLYDKAVTFGVNYARQKAHTLRDEPDSKGERINWATEQALKLIQDFGLPEKSADWVKGKIEAKLGEQERTPSETQPKPADTPE